MTYENILFEKKNSIAYVTVNRPKVLNALNMATMEELRSAFTDAKDDANIRVASSPAQARKHSSPAPTSASWPSTTPLAARNTRIAARACLI